MICEERKKRAIESFEQCFHKEPTNVIFSPGRLEIIGNHTDHQGGHCIVAGCSLGIVGVVRKRQDGLVKIKSEGYEEFSFSLNFLEQKNDEKFTSIALTKGVLFGLKQAGCNIGGFEASMNSDIFKGAGVSSSAAFEMFICETINCLYNNSSLDRMLLAKISQYSENVYFGKPSGLLDQTGSSLGGLVYVSFKNPKEPKIEKLPLPKWNLHIVLVNNSSSHDKLSDLYGEMPNDMKRVAKLSSNKNVLSECEPSVIYDFVRNSEEQIEERAKLRAIHYLEEDQRVTRCKKAIVSSNKEWFLELERESMISQTYLLKNVMVPGIYKSSPLETVDLSRPYVIDGASRVMGGGLAGSTINFVPDYELDEFIKEMSKRFGEENVVEVTIPEKGAYNERL